MYSLICFQTGVKRLQIKIRFTDVQRPIEVTLNGSIIIEVFECINKLDLI